MSRLHQAAIKELATEIAQGNTCYIDKASKQITTIDNSTEDPEVIAAQKLTITELERKIERYLKLERLSSADQLQIMEYFIEDVSDKSLSKELSNALKRKKPLRNFMQVIESDMELKQHWRIFKFKEDQRWVSNFIIDAYNY